MQKVLSMGSTSSQANQSVKPGMNKIDYSDIPLHLLKRQSHQIGGFAGKGKGRSLRASRLLDNSVEVMMPTMPGTSNGRMGSVDSNAQHY